MADWIKIGGNANSTVYFDPSSIQLQKDTVTMWNIMDLSAPDASLGTPYRSMKSLAEYDCKKILYRFIESQHFAGQMIEGELLLRNAIPSDWNPVPPHSAVKSLWKIACGNSLI